MRKLLIAVLVLALVAVTARAHGGSYRGPHGEIPPNMRPPEDPPPPHGDGTPTPPPEENPPGTPTGGDEPGNGRPPPPPQEPPGGGDVGRVPPRVPDGAGPGSGATTGPGRKGNGPPPPTLDNWEFWWGLNKDAILDLKGALGARDRAAVTGASILGAGRRLGKSPDGAQAPTLLAIEETIVPALERVVDDPDLHFDLRAGAVIALAKVASTLPAVQASTARRLIDVMNNADGKQHFSVEESGALALGLLQCRDEVVLTPSATAPWTGSVGGTRERARSPCSPSACSRSSPGTTATSGSPRRSRPSSGRRPPSRICPSAPSWRWGSPATRASCPTS
jgi:hypothetical protein